MNETSSPGPEASQPHNIEAEQQLLGAILLNNNLYDRISHNLKPDHFFDPFHGEIYSLASERISNGYLVSPVTMKTMLEDHPGLNELGGPAYLARMAGAAVSSFAIKDYAEMIFDLFVRRELIAVGNDLTAQAKEYEASYDASGLVTETEQRLFEIVERRRGGSGFKSFLRSAVDSIETANAAYQSDREIMGITTGLKDLDRKLGGFRNSDLIILAARPSMGKTALATNAALHIAKAYRRGTLIDGREGAVEGGVVGFFSLEMSAEQLTSRILSDASGISSQNVRNGNLAEFEFRRYVDAAKTLEAIPLHIDDTPALTIGQIAIRARRLKRQHGLELLIVDYLQLIHSSDRYVGNRVSEVSEITRGLKAIAKELDIPVVALSQLSRQVENREDKRPQLSDLRESGSIEQDADVVMFLFREEYYVERKKPGDHDLEKMAEWQDEMEAVSGKAEVIIGKQRHGPIGTVELAFEADFTRFSNLARPWTQQQGDAF